MKHKRTFYYKNINFITYGRDLTINDIIKGKSFIRLGDGEFELIKEKNIYFQKYEKLLKEILIKILKNKNNNYILGIYFKNNYNKRWNGYNDIIINHIKKNIIYCHDPLIFRYSKSNPELFLNFFKYLKNKNSIIVHNNKNGFDFIYKLCKNINFIKCKNKNCFDEYNNILNQISKNNNDNIILLSCGPTAKLLAYKLIELSYQVIDIGAGYKSLNYIYLNYFKNKII